LSGGHGQPQRSPSPPRSPRPPRLSRPPEREIRQRAAAGLIFGLLSLLALLGVGYNVHRGIYLVIFSLIIGSTACVLGITAIWRARRAGARRPRGAIAATIFGALATVLSVILLIGLTVFSRQFADYSRCMQVAQTAAAQHACTNQFYKSVDQGLPGAGG
jgi:hypothetical protein